VACNSSAGSSSFRVRRIGGHKPYGRNGEAWDASNNLRKEIKSVRHLTKKAFGINIPLDLQQSGELIDIVFRENIDIVVTAAGHPGHYTEVLRQSGIKVLHVVSSVRQAQTAQSCGVNAVIAEGVETAGHNGVDELPLFSLIPQVVDSISIPVVAAGGIADARGVVAAMALGAEGVQLGTRFVAVDECIAHPEHKKAIMAVSDTGTVITCRKVVPTRSLKTEFSRRLLELEDPGRVLKN
jgi:enoyl-[acyl-carrier protein] reductase II